MNLNKKLKRTIYTFTLASLIPATAFASGYQLNEESAASVGMALAGSGVAPDASVQFQNPAGISALSGFNALGGANIYVVNANFKNKGSTTALGTPLTGDASTDSNRFSPEGYVSYQIDDQFTAGLGIYSPFGLATSYPDNSSLRYFADSSDLRTLEINPNISFRLDDQLSIGAGPAIRWSRGEFSSAIDDGALGTAAGIRAGLPPALAAALGGPEANDARFRAEGTGWDAGYKLGILYEPDKATQIGIAYHSAMQTTISGNSTINNSGVTSPLAVAFATSPLAPKSTPVTAKIDYPDSVILSGSHKLNEDLRLTGDFEWTHWGRFQQLDLVFANGAPTQETVEEWQDGYRFSAGAEYQLMPQLKIRGGVAYEINPIGSDSTRTPRVPDGNRTWLSGGFGYDILPNVTFDFGYSHLFVGNTGIVQSNAIAGAIVGDYEDDSADIISADVAYHF